MLTGSATRSPRRSGPTRASTPDAAAAAVVELLELVGIPAPERRVAHYSAPALRRACASASMIAMALACEPELLIADEPTTALDVTIQAQILELLARAAATSSGMAILLITHDLGRGRGDRRPGRW